MDSNMTDAQEATPGQDSMLDGGTAFHFRTTSVSSVPERPETEEMDPIECTPVSTPGRHPRGTRKAAAATNAVKATATDEPEQPPTKQTRFDDGKDGGAPQRS